ncbi:hypothetical protein C2845_PM15G08440 [Panicum miliaceum]|uniref:Uncharacterized protein n=1 Tax=Panicum miliaceum TaxID=4540 RepID=A0A3L6Q5Q4_PANMI|nr:hypothetical protein C2845_PM15G08440 [Panicum miliaceum]
MSHGLLLRELSAEQECMEISDTKLIIQYTLILSSPHNHTNSLCHMRCMKVWAVTIQSAMNMFGQSNDINTFGQ